MAATTKSSAGKKEPALSQTLTVIFAIADALGIREDRELADSVGVSPETINNWRSGAVRELKRQKLDALLDVFRQRIDRNIVQRATPLLTPIEVAEGSNPAELQRQFRDRIHYDYLGHRFLYFDAQGALAWESLISTGYHQDLWLQGVRDCTEQWFGLGSAGKSTRSKAPLREGLGLDGRGRKKGLDILSLGPGEGSKEALIMERLCRSWAAELPWLSLTEVDVSIPLLIRASNAANTALAGVDTKEVSFTAICEDFEEGQLALLDRLPSSGMEPETRRRVVLILGNVFGNLRDEERFVRERLGRMMDTGDLLWIEVGVRPERIEEDPLFRLTQEGHEETASDANRRLLLEGPYRRWEAALGRPPTELALRIWLREDDDAARVRGSVNFCHDIVIPRERRSCTMLYSRRYKPDELAGWFRRLGFVVEAKQSVKDGRGRERVCHLLLRKA